MSHPFGVLIIGCGDMGNAHAKAWHQREDAELIAVFDPDTSRASKMSENYACKTYTDIDEALQRADIQIVSVCTPVCFHPQYAIAAAKAGKHIICEKPIALSVEAARSMREAADEAGVQLAVSYQYRAWPKFAKVKELIDSNEIQGPIFLRFTDVREVRPKVAMHRQSMNGGPMVDMAGHFFDLMYALTGEKPESVFASGHVFGGGKARLAGIHDLAIDAAEIIVKYHGGHTLSAHINWALPEGSKAHTNAEIITGQQVIDLNDQETLKLIGAAETRLLSLAKMPVGPAMVIDELIKAIHGQPHIMVTGEEGQQALSVSLAVLEAIQTGQLIQIA